MAILFFDLGATKKQLMRYKMTIPIQRSHIREHVPISVWIPPLKKTLPRVASKRLFLNIYGVYICGVCRYVIIGKGQNRKGQISLDRSIKRGHILAK
jgi:hypothetical protein